MSSSRRLRVLLAVSPPLLAETLARALADDDLEVVVHHDAGQDEGHEVFEVGVVTGALPPGVDVAVVVSLPADDAGTGPARIRTDAGEREVVITDIASVRHLIEEVSPDAPGLGSHAEARSSSEGQRGPNPGAMAVSQD